ERRHPEAYDIHPLDGHRVRPREPAGREVHQRTRGARRARRRQGGAAPGVVLARLHDSGLVRHPPGHRQPLGGL
ncbi:MAG: hypothetical protein AVDCRST_MAG02-4197, partial [uncultured Rubrobacteraceae bacterium]